MSLGKTPSLKIQAYKESFLAALSRAVAAPTEGFPTVRCWTKPSLNRLFKKIQNEMEKAERPPCSNVELLRWMGKLGLASEVEAEGEKFHILEIGAGPDSGVSPQELMMAYKPSGVVCYFSALAVHSLTSQPPSHHHVAALVEARTSGLVREARSRIDEKTREDRTEVEAAVAQPTSRSESLGKLVFHHLGVPYYLTRRVASSVPGVQIRIDGPRGRFRVTTYEQVLLDTLSKPRHCGGAAVVFEAWNEALSSGRLDEDRLADYLAEMEYPATDRRLGAMLRLINHRPGTTLAVYLERARNAVDRKATHARISLLPGFDFADLDEEWLVGIP